MPDLAKKITPGFQALLVIISILTAFISISYLPMLFQQPLAYQDFDV